MARQAGRRGNHEGTIFEDKARGRWKAGVTLGDGSRRWVTGRTREAVAEKLAVMLGQAASGAPVPKAGTLSGQIDHWRDYVLPSMRLAPATVSQAIWALGIVQTHLGRVRLAKLSAEHVDHFLVARAAEGYSVSSLKRFRGVLSQVLTEAVRRGHVLRDVARLAHIPASAPTPAPRRALNPEEGRRLLDAATGDRLEAFYVLALTTGARRGELLGLAWDDVDLKAGTMTIRRALRRGRGGGYELGPPKTDASVRTVRLGPVALDALKAHKMAQKSERLAALKWTDSGLVFTTTTGTPVDPTRLGREWRVIRHEAGLDDVVLHELRHTAGSVAVDAGVPLTEVADQLGHSDVAMLARVYRHRTRPVVEGVASVMDAFVTAPSKG